MGSRVILVGGGHAHLKAVQSIMEERPAHIEVLLISPSSYQYYSGMFSGYTEGIYTKEQIRIDLKQLCARAGIRFIEKTAVLLKTAEKKLVCADGSVYPFDVISFDIGSKNVPQELTQDAVHSIKPNYTFIDHIDSLRESRFPLIVGGGAAGTELALSIRAYKRRNNLEGTVRLISSEDVLSSEPKLTSLKLKRLLKKSGVQVWDHERAVEVHEDHVRTDRNNKVRHTGVLWLGGPVAPPIFEKSALPLDEHGFVSVEGTLQVEGYPYIFAAGDCATLKDHRDLPKNGVYAVRQGPVLWGNIRKYINKQDDLETFEPQARYLYILSTGFQEGFLVYGAFSMHGKQAWKIKNKIDQAFMDEFKF
ncbi:FAD-dependent oxidoreductase [Thalassobacillus hwangdonensis]|uniref:FAD-dependent oxidoreductase n=1 Tax=Thalassobacillus hwangdonensis TaxID=546108 RepID=A0ABW3L0H3_9BACI